MSVQKVLTTGDINVEGGLAYGESIKCIGAEMYTIIVDKNEHRGRPIITWVQRHSDEKIWDCTDGRDFPFPEMLKKAMSDNTESMFSETILRQTMRLHIFEVQHFLVTALGDATHYCKPILDQVLLRNVGYRLPKFWIGNADELREIEASVMLPYTTAQLAIMLDAHPHIVKLDPVLFRQVIVDHYRAKIIEELFCCALVLARG